MSPFVPTLPQPRLNQPGANAIESPSRALSRTQTSQTREGNLESSPSSTSQATAPSPPTETFLGHVVQIKDQKSVRRKWVSVPHDLGEGD
ncbi:hypothetical protein SNOG_11725 [Parastagonospora nodorum SN15]|uniref:Uncharacterized protein n=1 Tax=Phaeosphaeria nodorum (strain SN15 / ATCC MYA-4574 / FGSC 10173) TaxID=321614 RepID=Q0U939_PHANO|nr:hypothetical protein SNOG_11725 [Parastagonospora nodorum SN15]EAT80769.1 hypothetical protein SNOG_11725 [Parastagonospora nodorum SN15]